MLDKESIYSKMLGFKERPIPSKNNISNYLPYSSKGADFSYSYVAGSILSSLLNKKLPADFKLEDLSAKVIRKLNKWTGEVAMGDLAEKIYFSNNGLLNKLSPIFLILNTIKGEDDEKVSQSSKDLADLFCESIVKSNFQVTEPNSNFIEKILVDKFKEQLTNTTKKSRKVMPYLPFLSTCFQKDIAFLCSKPQFLLEKIEDFLCLYNFLYCSQLGANIRNWKVGEPSSVEHYFIIDTEKCSAERRAAHTYKDLKLSVENIFPMLTLVYEINTVLDKAAPYLPLWKIADLLKSLTVEQQSDLAEALSDYSERFCEEEASKGREIMPRDRAEFADGLLGDLERFVKITLDQFDPKRVIGKSTKDNMVKKYLNPFEQEVAKHFVQARGRLGKVLVINQDHLLMLTNVVIGDAGEMRLQEILYEFEKRGVYLDKLSRLSLIEFYERIGNIKRMSDSGDAVYVKSTV